MPSMRWASDALIPDLLRVERTLLFDRILNQLWASLLAQVAPGNAAAGAAAAGAAANGGMAAAAAANGTAAANGVAKAAGAPTKRAMQVRASGTAQLCLFLGAAGCLARMCLVSKCSDRGGLARVSHLP